MITIILNKALRISSFSVVALFAYSLSCYAMDPRSVEIGQEIVTMREIDQREKDRLEWLMLQLGEDTEKGIANLREAIGLSIAKRNAGYLRALLKASEKKVDLREILNENKNNSPPFLHRALCLSQQTPELIQVLLYYKADPNLKVLEDNRSKINIYPGDTAAHVAVRHRQHWKVLLMLAWYETDFWVKNYCPKLHKTPREIAVYYNFDEVGITLSYIMKNFPKRPWRSQHESVELHHIFEDYQKCVLYQS